MWICRCCRHGGLLAGYPPFPCLTRVLCPPNEPRSIQPAFAEWPIWKVPELFSLFLTKPPSVCNIDVLVKKSSRIYYFLYHYYNHSRLIVCPGNKRLIIFDLLSFFRYPRGITGHIFMKLGGEDIRSQCPNREEWCMWHIAGVYTASELGLG